MLYSMAYTHVGEGMVTVYKNENNLSSWYLYLYKIKNY